MTSIQMLGQETIGSATRRTSRNAATMQWTPINNVDLLPRPFVEGVHIREGSTSARVTPRLGKV